jgi:hypothetical protein
MFRHMAIVSLDPLVCDKNTFCNAFLILQWLEGGRDLVLQSVGVLACAGYVEYL